MTINVLEVIRQGQVGGGESHLLDLIAGFDERVNPIVLAFTGGQMIDELEEVSDVTSLTLRILLTYVSQNKSRS